MRTTTQYICSHFPNETDHLCIGLIPREKAPCYLTLTSVFTNSACIGFKWSMWICFRISLRGLTTLQLKAARCHPRLFFSPLTQSQVTELGGCCWCSFFFSFFFFFPHIFDWFERDNITGKRRLQWAVLWNWRFHPDCVFLLHYWGEEWGGNKYTKNPLSW